MGGQSQSAYDFRLTALQSNTVFQQLCRCGSSGGDGHLIGKGKGFFLNTGNQTDIFCLDALLDASFCAIQHMATTAERSWQVPSKPLSFISPMGKAVSDIWM